MSVSKAQRKKIGDKKREKHRLFSHGKRFHDILSEGFHHLIDEQIHCLLI